MRSALLAALVLAALPSALLAEDLQVGIGAADITPDLKQGQPVWMAGYGFNRAATGVHDPLYARAVAFKHGAQKLALISVDLVGVQHPLVKRIRAELKDYDYVVVSSTHNHEGPDVIGIWGQTPLQSGIDPAYLRFVVKQSVAAVRNAEQMQQVVTVEFGTATDESLLGDSRQPKVFDGTLRTLLFKNSRGTPHGLLVQWNCHPEALGRRNTLITADFPWATVAALEKKYGCPIAYFSGAVGGLMAPPEGPVKDAKGNVLKDENYEYARIYGEMVAALAEKSVAAGKPIQLAPWSVAAKDVYLPVENQIYRIAKVSGAIPRDAFEWTGDANKPGEIFTIDNADKPMAIRTEVACIRFADLDLACIPGELYPELVYGKFQDPPDAGADFPDAPLEPHVSKIFGERKWMLFGLANDEVGYLIPRRQWDRKSPFCYGRKEAQYGEINSCGPDSAAVVMKALAERVKELAK